MKNTKTILVPTGFILKAKCHLRFHFSADYLLFPLQRKIIAMLENKQTKIYFSSHIIIFTKKNTW